MADELGDHGFVTRPLRGNTLQIGPPVITTDAELRGLVQAMGTVVTGPERSSAH